MSNSIKAMFRNGEGSIMNSSRTKRQKNNTLRISAKSTSPHLSESKMLTEYIACRVGNTSAHFLLCTNQVVSVVTDSLRLSWSSAIRESTPREVGSWYDFDVFLGPQTSPRGDVDSSSRKFRLRTLQRKIPHIIRRKIHKAAMSIENLSKISDSQKATQSLLYHGFPREVSCSCQYRRG